MIYIEHRRKSEKNLKEKYPTAHIVDVTSKGIAGWVKLSPFFPHGDIPIPFSPGKTAKSVEGIWQGLKVFEKVDIDLKMFENDTMKNIKRTVRKFGKPLGHRKGINGIELLDYIEARIQIYLPAYLWMLENKAGKITERLKEANQERDIVLLDYATNCDVLDPSKPLSHAYLVKAYIDGNYPTVESLAAQKKKGKPETIDMRLLLEVWKRHSNEEIAKQSRIRKNIIGKIRQAIKEDHNINFEKLSNLKGLGKVTLKKLEDFIKDYQTPTSNQPTLF